METDETYHFVELQYTKCLIELKDEFGTFIMFTRERDTVIT